MKRRFATACFITAALLLVGCPEDDPNDSGTPTGGVGTGGQGSGTGGIPGGIASGGTTGSTGGSGTGGTVTSGAATGGLPGGGGSGEAPSDPTSCQVEGPGLTDCGPDGEDCCTSLAVPGGTFDRTYTNNGIGAADQADPATISEFRLDKYLVTVARYRKFVDAWEGGYRPPIGAGKHRHLNAGNGLVDSGNDSAFEGGWTAEDNDNLAPTSENLVCDSDDATWTDRPGDNEGLPINCVNWFEAYAFCIWDGGFLPSEAEFIYAAAGGSEQRQYPWGTDEPGADNRYAVYGCNYPVAGNVCTGVANIAPVGTAVAGAGRWGQLDLVGNLMQWNLDFNYTFVTPCEDCAYLTGGSGRAIRDGYFSSGLPTLLVPYRNTVYGTNRFGSYGVRCARIP